MPVPKTFDVALPEGIYVLLVIRISRHSNPVKIKEVKDSSPSAPSPPQGFHLVLGFFVPGLPRNATQYLCLCHQTEQVSTSSPHKGYS